MRNAQIERKTKETDISLSLSLDGGKISIDTGIGFFDHMLNSFATHGGFGLEVKVKGDLNVDDHHTVEDTGIVLGTAFKEALADKSSIERFGSFYIPMDEALSFASVDISGRPFLVFDAEFPQEKCGDYTSALTVEFMRALAFNAGITLHVKSLYGSNSHHIVESIYKSVAHAMRLAVKNNNSGDVLSTKGVL
ncbi:MAG: imidazoleglycerol-phosphate dehydratase HisB [Ruminococcus sp.]|nr:imidazoleglycerol-phosphate dehydratase HisB [Ruminococcus sp.]